MGRDSLRCYTTGRQGSFSSVSLCLLVACLLPVAKSTRLVGVDEQDAASRLGLLEDDVAEKKFGGDDVNEALNSSQALWEHAEIKDCLEHEHFPTSEDLRSSLTRRVWELELKHEIFSRLSNSLLSYVTRELAARVSKEAAVQKEIDVAEKRELKKMKEILVDEYGFHYDVKKEACLLAARPRLEAAEAQVESELAEGCGGRCSKKSAMGACECKEASAENPCPEGTRCACHIKKQQGLGAAVGAVSYVLAWGAMAYLIPGGAVLPGPMEMSMMVSWLVASRAEGCRCFLSPCAWDSDRKTCAPKVAKGAQNPFQAALPYVGQVCTPKSHGLRAFVADKTSLVDPGCELRACLMNDGYEVGQVGNETLNCQLGGANKRTSPSAMFPPLKERMQKYMKLFPKHYEAHMQRGGHGAA